MSAVDLIITIIVGTLCLGATIFGYWNIISGWNEPNEIIKFFSSFNDTSLGFGPYVMVHGVANWALFIYADSTGKSHSSRSTDAYMVYLGMLSVYV